MSQIIKPQPLVLGGKAHYTLSSYGPVRVEVYVPRVTDEEVDLMVDQVLASVGGTRADLADPVWMGAHLEGLHDADELRGALRREIEAANEAQVEQAKEEACLDKLAERLGQSVLQSEVQNILADLMASFERDAGTTIDSIASQMGSSRTAIEQMFASQAQHMAEQEAALDAYAREKKLTVDESEYPQLLGLSPEQARQIVAQTAALGRGDALQQAALHAKAELAVVAECTCTYHHETEEEAAERVSAMRAQLARQGGQATGGSSTTGADKGFKLV